MKITAINFRAQDTQILSAIYKKEHIVPRDIYTVDSMLPSIIGGETARLAEFFGKLKKEMPRGLGKIFAAVPSYLTRINCATGEYDQTMNLDSTAEKWKLQILDIGDGQEWYADIALAIKRPTKLSLTAAAIHKTHIDTLLEAALQEKVYLYSVEPACIATMRYMDKWKETYCILEYDQDQLTLCGYHPERGAFVMSDYLFADVADPSARLAKLLPLFDFAANSTFIGLDGGNMAIVRTGDADGFASVLEGANYGYRKSNLPASNRFIESAGQSFAKWAEVFGLALHLQYLKENEN